jgi:hypothetical protein
MQNIGGRPGSGRGGEQTRRCAGPPPRERSVPLPVPDERAEQVPANVARNVIEQLLHLVRLDDGHRR